MNECNGMTMFETKLPRSIAVRVLLVPFMMMMTMIHVPDVHGFPTTTLSSSSRQNPSLTSTLVVVVPQQQRLAWVSLASSKQQQHQSPSPPPPPPLDFEIQSTVLKQLYPSLIEYMETYGHPNIPLGTPEGNQCRMVRRLHIQQKLTEEEVEWLTSLNFHFHNLEDVYFEVDFDTMVTTLVEYEAEFQTNYQIPKKYKPNPELGAWVTGIRRLYNNPSKYASTTNTDTDTKKQLDPTHIDKLNSIGFAWQSTRKCKSPFMTQYRDLKARCSSSPEEGGDGESIHTIMKQEPTILKWIQTQQDVYHKGNLSETRTLYLSQLLDNEEWMTTTYE